MLNKHLLDIHTEILLTPSALLEIGPHTALQDSLFVVALQGEKQISDWTVSWPPMHIVTAQSRDLVIYAMIGQSRDLFIYAMIGQSS